MEGSRATVPIRHTIISVSYTHLDVYKRQDKLDVSAFHGLDPVRAELYRLCEQRGVGITVMKALGAVSYTHLDVDKRQDI